MNRDFEKEYQEYTAQDLPDLWNRIEPNLLPRDQIDKEVTENKDTIVKKDVFEAKRNRKRVLRSIMSVAAALVVLLISVRVIRIGMFQSNTNMETSDMLVADDAACEEAYSEEAPAEEAASEEADYEAEEAMSGLAADDVSKDAERNEAVAVTEEAEEDEAYDYAPMTESLHAVTINQATLVDISDISGMNLYDNRYAFALTFQVETESGMGLVRVFASEEEYETYQDVFINGEVTYEIVVETSTELDEQNMRIDAHLVSASREK